MGEKQVLDLYRNEKAIMKDAYDRVVVNLFHENQEHGYRTFTICGCNAGAGSTSIALELAIALSVSGWKTVLIDADMRKENQYKRLNQKVEYGLSDYINQRLSADDIIYPTNWEGLYCITCGHQVGWTPVKLLCSQRMSELMAYLRENYDFVLYDVPALNSSVDAQIVGEKTEGTFLVTSSGETTFHDLQTAKQHLEDAGANILGVILNKVTMDDYRHYMHDYNYFADKEYLKRSRYYKQKEQEQKGKQRLSLLKWIQKLMGCLLVMLMLGVLCPSPAPTAAHAEATDTGTELSVNGIPVVILDGYEIRGDIAAGKEFTIVLHVKNADPGVDVRQLTISLHATTGGFYLGDGEINQRYVERLRAGRVYDCEFTLQVLSNFTAEALPIELHFDYMSDAGQGENVATISPALKQDCEIDVISVVTPESAIIGANALLSVQYKNSGTAEPSSVSMRIRGNIVTHDQEIPLKIPAPGRQEYVESSIAFTDAGEQQLDVYISYTDDDGNVYEVEPQHIVTRVMSYNEHRTVYGTGAAWDKKDAHLVKRTSFTSVLQKIQHEYGWAIWLAAALLVLDSIWHLVRWRRDNNASNGKAKGKRNNTAKGKRKRDPARAQSGNTRPKRKKSETAKRGRKE